MARFPSGRPIFIASFSPLLGIGFSPPQTLTIKLSPAAAHTNNPYPSFIQCRQDSQAFVSFKLIEVVAVQGSGEMAIPLGSSPSPSPSPRYLTISALFLISALDAAIPPFSSFSFNAFEKNRTFDSEIALYGDAEIADSMIRITRPAVSSRGRVMYRKPIRFLGAKPGFSAYFSFSVSPGKGGGLGLAFLLVPSGTPLESIPPRILSVEYVASRIVVNLGGEISIKSRNLSGVNLVMDMDSGEKLHSWVDYDGESKRLEVRLSNSTDPRQADSLISYPIDLSSVLWREAVFVGISSSSGNSTQTSSLHSWSFGIKHGAPYLMHSEPLDARAFLAKSHEGPPIHVRRAHPWRILMAIVFVAACGLLVASTVLFALSTMFDRPQVVPVESPENPIECGDEKIVPLGDKGADSSSK